ncbi:MAG: hypothetical protein AAFZ18_23935 [Myxococcota bacterium]
MSGNKSSADLPLWGLVSALGLGSAALFAYGLTQPAGPRNLADPMPVAMAAPRVAGFRASEKSVQRRLAEKKDAAQVKECEDRLHDCSTACDVYPKQSQSRAECFAFCDRSKASCLEWAHH